MHLVAIGAITTWGFLAWSLPWPGLLIGAVTFVVLVFAWALFLSPRPVLRIDRFGQALAELLLLAGAVACALALSVHWAWPIGFAILGIAIGLLASTRRRVL